MLPELGIPGFLLRAVREVEQGAVAERTGLHYPGPGGPPAAVAGQGLRHVGAAALGQLLGQDRAIFDGLGGTLRAALRHGSEAIELDPRLHRAEGDIVVVKHGPSAFFGTGLAPLLVGLGVDTVVICGATTSGCVRASVVDAVQHGFPVLVPRECVADRARAPHEASLFDLQAKYADVISAGDAAGYLTACAAPS